MRAADTCATQCLFRPMTLSQIAPRCHVSRSMTDCDWRSPSRKWTFLPYIRDSSRLARGACIYSASMQTCWPTGAEIGLALRRRAGSTIRDDGCGLTSSHGSHPPTTGLTRRNNTRRQCPPTPQHRAIQGISHLRSPPTSRPWHSSRLCTGLPRSCPPAQPIRAPRRARRR